MSASRVLRVFALLGVFAACSDGSTSTPPGTTTTIRSTTSAATSTTVDPAVQASAYTEIGPFPVGVTTLQLASGPLVEVWYPAVEGTTGTEAYDVRDFTPQALRDLLTAGAVATRTYPAGRDADVADGEFPVVLFSHGFIGFRLQSTFITAHLASWGMIVVAPDHPGRDLPHLLDLLDETATRPVDTSVDQLLESLDVIVAEGDDSAGRFSGHVDSTRVATLGHSAGGGTALRAADDERIDGYVSMASGALRTRSSDPSTDGTSTTSTVPTLPDKPSFFIAGSADSVVPPETVTRPSFAAAPSPSLLWVIEGAGHQAFSDLCTVGDGAGIIGLADANGLGPFLDGFPRIRVLGEDGCLPPAVPVETTFPIIDHAVTAWLRDLFGLDEAPVGLGPDVADQYPAPVAIDVK